MYVVRLDVNGRVRIPAEVRKANGWKKGQAFLMEVDNGEIKLKPVDYKKVVINNNGEVIEID